MSLKVCRGSQLGGPRTVPGADGEICSAPPARSEGPSQQRQHTRTARAISWWTFSTQKQGQCQRWACPAHTGPGSHGNPGAHPQLGCPICIFGTPKTTWEWAPDTGSTNQGDDYPDKSITREWQETPGGCLGAWGGGGTLLGQCQAPSCSIPSSTQPVSQGMGWQGRCHCLGCTWGHEEHCPGQAEAAAPVWAQRLPHRRGCTWAPAPPHQAWGV